MYSMTKFPSNFELLGREINHSSIKWDETWPACSLCSAEKCVQSSKGEGTCIYLYITLCERYMLNLESYFQNFTCHLIRLCTKSFALVATNFHGESIIVSLGSF